MTASTAVQDLQRRHPEWEPWLAVIQEIVRAIVHPQWEALVPIRGETQQPNFPLIHGASLIFEPTSARLLFEQLIQIAVRSGTPKMATLTAALGAKLDWTSLFRASLSHDRASINAIAQVVGADTEAFQAIVALIPIPLLQACYRRWASSISESWMEGYCPVCGAWPAFAEVRGLDRGRYFRCGRCGSDWQAHCLFCPYCGTTDHEQLLALVPGKELPSQLVEACKHCLGYVKVFTTLQASPADKVIVDDLASVALDIAAVDCGYQRPLGVGYAVDLRIREETGCRSSFT